MNSIKSVLSIAIALILATSISATAKKENPNDEDPDLLISTRYGKVKGIREKGCIRFMGIPYAAPPKGHLRWKAPVPPVPWKGIKDASKPCSACPQQPVAYAKVSSDNEDCLFLNINSPLSKENLKPVMVWIHGDGSIGSGDLFDPAKLVETGNVIVVTINYRLGIFGGFGYPRLKNSGAFGLLDQQAALKWIRENIKTFGGDPNNITLFGVSYGALSVSAQLISPASASLFQKAILQSGFALMDLPAEAMYPGMGAMPWFGWRDQEEIKQLGKEMAKKLKSSNLEELKKIGVRELLPYLSIFQLYPYHSEAIPLSPEEAFKSGRFHRVPMITGNTRDEHRTFVSLFRLLSGNEISAEGYTTLIEKAFGRSAARIKEQYPVSAYSSPALAWATLLTDRMWAKSTYRLNMYLSRFTKVYAYEFNDQHAPSDLSFPESLPAGAFHSAETNYVFPNASFLKQLTDDQLRLSDRMIRYWSNFAWQGDPNGNPMPDWKTFNAEENRPFVLPLEPGDKSAGLLDYREEHQLDFWDSIRE